MATLEDKDADMWRKTLQRFDATRAEFLSAVSDLLNRKAPNAALEKERQKLIREARPIKVSMDAILSTLQKVRDWLKQFNFSFGGATLGDMGFPFLAIPLTIGAVALVIAAAGAFVERWKKYDALRTQVEAAERAGASGSEIADIGKPPKVQPKLFGLDSGAVKWIFGIAAVMIAGPYVLKEIEKRR